MNGGNWQTANLDSHELINTYIPSLNMQNHLFSNCKQLEDDKMWITPDKGLVLKMITESKQNNITMRLESIIEYDNTIKNGRNPYNPPQDIKYGWGTKDEMMNLIFQFVEYQPGDEK